MTTNIALYTSKECMDDSGRLRDFLLHVGVPFEEYDVTARPDWHTDLIKRFGGQVTLPGIQINDKWITDTDDLRDALGRCWVDHLLTLDPSSTRGRVRSQDIHVKPSRDDKESDSSDYNAKDGTPSTMNKRSLKSTPSMTSHSTATICSSVLTNIILPNGSETTAGELTRCLLRATNHRCIAEDGNPYYFFRGYEGLDLWSILFFGNEETEEIESFGKMLIQCGFVHNYTPHCKDFSKTFLVLQPLQEPRVLNTFIKWPSDKHSNDDPMDVILRVSRLMDDVCSLSDYRDNLSLFHELEEAVCQLQVVHFPENPVEKVTFALNLFNLVMRHAILIAEEREWTWPESLDELKPFLSKIGYKVGGEWFSLADLQSSLYGRSGESAPALVPVKKKGRRLRFSCMSHHKQQDVYYESATIRTDPRLLLATTWGASSSPAVSTIYPNTLEEGLQTAAELYCRQHVKVGLDGVVLPALLSWHRADFGGSVERVLNNVLPYLSVIQLHQIQDLRDTGRLHSVFDSSFNWKCSLRPEQVTPAEKAIRPDVEQARGFKPDDLGMFQDPTDCKSQISRGGGSKTLRVMRRCFGREPSRGESQLFAPGRDFGMPDTTEPTYDDEDDGHTFFQSVVSDITFESDFRSLKSKFSQRKLEI